MDYNFSTLNDRDLEELSRDLLSREFATPFESFKPGQDQGIDLRFSKSSDDPTIIVQVKHYLNSGIRRLLSDLRKKEYPKITNLAPTRYILVTSLPLSPADKSKLLESLSPYVHSSGDIIGQQDLNRMLGSYKRVEENHFKLWLSSTTVLTRILQNAIKGRSSFHRERIEKQVAIFVRTAAHSEAIRLLKKNNFLMITGAPGIGKSTLADFISYQLMAEDFELIYTSDIKEAEESYLPDSKQVFYLDDFLGAIALNLHTPRNFDAQITEFIRRVQSDKNKRLLLTCRTVILHQAKEISEKIENANLDASKYELIIKDYNPYQKARILYNHIYASNLPNKFKSEFSKNRFYWDIIKHKNYNPRIIQFFTDPKMIELDKNFQQTVKNFLDNPKKIWEKPFHQQLTWPSRLLLRTLFLFDSPEVSPSDLEFAFNAALHFEVKEHGFTHEPRLYTKALKELEGAYIATTHKKTGSGQTSAIRILNPSLEDYLVFYYSGEGRNEYILALRTATHAEQFSGRIETLYTKNKISLHYEERTMVWGIYQQKIGNFRTLKGDPRWQEILVMTQLFKWKDIAPTVTRFLEDFKEDRVAWTDFERVSAVTEYVAGCKDIENLPQLLDRYILMLADNILSSWQQENLCKMLAKNLSCASHIWERMSGGHPWFEQLQECIDRSWAFFLNDYVFQNVRFSFCTKKDKILEAADNSLWSAVELNLNVGLKRSPAMSQYKFDYGAYKKSLGNTKEKSKPKLATKDDSPTEPDAINSLFNCKGPDVNTEIPF